MKGNGIGRMKTGGRPKADSPLLDATLPAVVAKKPKGFQRGNKLGKQRKIDNLSKIEKRERAIQYWLDNVDRLIKVGEDGEPIMPSMGDYVMEGVHQAMRTEDGNMIALLFDRSDQFFNLANKLIATTSKKEVVNTTRWKLEIDRTPIKEFNIEDYKATDEEIEKAAEDADYIEWEE